MKSTVPIDVPQNSDFGTKCSASWKIYELREHPGLFIIKDPFTASGQRYWAMKCLQEYPKSPHITNLSNLGRGNNNWWTDLQSKTASTSEYRQLRNSLRWVTLGYHHNWDTKVYSEDNVTPFPAALGEMVEQVFARALGYDDYRPQAAIVNYYPPGSTLSGHTDHSEVNLDAPLFSFSFGQSAIFLIGGPDKSDPASAILLESGDVMIMTRRSRLCYHAVPKILKGAAERWQVEGHDDERTEEQWRPFDEYLSECRININVRQVLCNNQRSLDDE